MRTIKMLENYYSYIKDHIYEMPDIDAEAIVMSGNAIFIINGTGS